MSGTLPPKRTESQEITLVVPRSSLPPVSVVPGPTVEQIAEVERVRRETAQRRITLVPCPACECCPTCEGTRMVTPERSAAWRREQALDDASPDFDPPPTEAA
jgi:hypothetical protein